MNTAGTPIWRLKEPDVQSVRAWEDGCVVYHALSGDTHYLTGLASQIYLRLAEAPASLDRLMDLDRENEDEAPDPPPSRLDTESVLRELVKRGLIEWT